MKKRPAGRLEIFMSNIASMGPAIAATIYVILKEIVDWLRTRPFSRKRSEQTLIDITPVSKWQRLRRFFGRRVKIRQ